MLGVDKTWGDQFNKSVIHFTGRNKVYALGDKSGGPVVTKTSALVKALVGLSQTDPNQLAPKDQTKDALKAYEKHLAAFRKEQKTYGGYLKDAIKAVDKKTWPEAYRELKLLDTTLGALGGKIEQHYLQVSKKKELDKIYDKSTKEKDKQFKKGNDDKAKEAEALGAMKKFRMMLSTQGNSGLKKALLAIQQIKANPDVTTYNQVMNSAGRDVSQWLVNIKKLRDHKTMGKLPDVKKIPDPAKYTALATEYGNGAKRKLDVAADQATVLLHLKEFSQMIKSMSADYAAVLKGK